MMWIVVAQLSLCLVALLAINSGFYSLRHTLEQYGIGLNEYTHRVVSADARTEESDHRHAGEPMPYMHCHTILGEDRTGLTYCLKPIAHRGAHEEDQLNILRMLDTVPDVYVAAVRAEGEEVHDN